MNNSNVSLKDVREIAMQTIAELKSGKIKTSDAKEIRELLNTVIQTGKCQVDLLNAIPKNLKDNLSFENILQIEGTYRDDEYELDKTLREIDEKNKKTYEFKKLG